VIEREQLVFAAICDLAGQVRGKAFPLADLASRMRAGVGYTHSNIMMSAFGPIYETPFGTAGDLMLVPDPDARVEVAFAEGDVERFYLSDLRTTDGGYWECCPRDFLRRGLAALEHEAGLTLTAAFEQEFVYTGVADRPSSTYGLDLFRRQGAMGEILLGALRQAGVTPDSFMAEYGPRQFEVTVAPKPGLRAADEAVIVREMARATAHRLGHRAIMAPMQAPDGTGSGTHIHFSLQDARGRPAMPEPGAAFGLSPVAASFVAGVVEHLPALCALTAPSVASYYRLTPNRWAPTWAVLLEQDRGSALRICPVFAAASAEDAAAKFNVEYRVADAAASPYMALGALVHAGLDGIRRKLPPPSPPPADFWTRDDAGKAAAGVRALPATLDAALDALEASEAAHGWLGATLRHAYLRLKRAEIAALSGMTPAEICHRYAEAY
jgi:glutamine synthetase